MLALHTSRFFLAFLLAIFHTFSVSAYTIHPDCAEFVVQITTAINETVRIAEYGKWRMADKTPEIGPVVSQLLGDGDIGPSLFIERMGKVDSTFGKYTGTWDNLNPEKDNTVVIRCGSDYWTLGDPLKTQIDGEFDRRWKDTEFKIAVFGDKDRPCAQDGTAAITYKTGFHHPQGPSDVISICHPDPLLASNIGLHWMNGWEYRDFRALSPYMSVILLHESMNAQSQKMESWLPSERAETYGWDEIQALDDGDKQANADSFAIMDSVLWIKNYMIGGDGKFGKRYDEGSQPVSLPEDGHSSKHWLADELLKCLPTHHYEL